MLVDVEPETLTMDPAAFEAAITPRTKAVMPVHLAGHPARIGEIVDIAQRHGIAVVEDAAQAIGAYVDGRPIGNVQGSAAACFSFHPTKLVTTIEGGALLTDDADLAATARLYRMHGISSDSWTRHGNASLWETVAPGFKYNLTDVQAAVGLHQLGRLDGFLATRARLAIRYVEELAAFPMLQPLGIRPGVRHGWHLFIVQLELGATELDRDGLRAAMLAENIGTGVHFRSLHLHPYYQALTGLSPAALPVAAAASDRVLSLPFSSGMSDADLDDVVAALAKILSRNVV